ncbi:helix-turn-helix domain-containing protein [Chloroflexota bacterium]
MDRRGEEWFPEFVTTGLVAKYCGVSNTTALRWIKTGQLQAFVLPSGHYRIHRDDFSEFLTNYRTLVRPQFKDNNHGGQAKI